jgi:aspartyl-tRNA(Asn)/glutamyl-tRNA(Gln) amidotransferase subunit C
MSISEDQIKKIAKLARISLEPEEVKPLAEQVGSIINWVEQLAEVNTNNIEAISNINNLTLPTRQDKANLNQENIFSNSGKKIFDYFVVPKVLE